MQSDVIGLIEALYSLDNDQERWLRQVVQAAALLVPAQRTMTGFVWDARGRQPVMSHAWVDGQSELSAEELKTAALPSSPEAVRSMWLDMPAVALASGTRGHVLHVPQHPLAKVAKRDNVQDFVGIKGSCEPRFGVMLSYGLRDGELLAPRMLQMWGRLSVHLGTSFRLLQSTLASTCASEKHGDAILTPDGQIVHAQREATSKNARTNLSLAAQRIDRARGKLRRVDPDEAAALWRALVGGQWTLIDHFDSDGRRFVVAQQNAPQPLACTASLSKREAQVATLLARGYANKLIAYELGISESSVSVLLGRACVKLGVLSRLELVRRIKEASGGEK